MLHRQVTKECLCPRELTICGSVYMAKDSMGKRTLASQTLALI